MQMTAAVTNPAERKRLEAVVETLASMHRHGENLDELAHDARNMVTALTLYCDLLEEPGVLAAGHRHYASELRLVAEASRRLVEKLARIDSGDAGEIASPGLTAARQPSPSPTASGPTHLFRTNGMSSLPVQFIADLRSEMLAVRELLGAVAGPAIRVNVSAEGGAYRVRMTTENLIRVLVNLVKNSAESISGPGSIDLTLADGIHCNGAIRWVIVLVQDSGSGVSPDLLEKIFESGFTTRAASRPDGTRDPGHRGLGLSITRSIVEEAGGHIHAENRPSGGARFVIELPVSTL